MKQIVNSRGELVHGLFKKEDGSIVVVDDQAWKKNLAAKNVIDSMRLEIDDLRKLVMSMIK